MRYQIITDTRTRAWLTADSEEDAKRIALRVLPKGTQITRVIPQRWIIVEK